MRWHHIAGSALIIPFVLAGCATTSNEELNYLNAINRKVTNLEQTVTPSVNQLNQTTAELTARMDSTEQQTRAIGTNLETMQAELQEMRQQLASMTSAVYKQQGLSAPKSNSTVSPRDPSVLPGPVVPDATAPSGGPGAPESDLSAPGATASATPPLDSMTVGSDAGDDVANQIPLNPLPSGTEMAAATPAPAAPAAETVDLYQQAMDLYRKEDYAQAEKLFAAYIQQNPNGEKAGRADFWRGQSLLQLKRNKEAIQSFERARQSATAEDIVPYAMYMQADAHLQLRETQEAIALLRKLVNDWPGTQPAQRAKAELEKRGL